jgi:serine protease Do
MKTIRLSLLACAAVVMLLWPDHVAAGEAHANVDLARQLNQAFVEVAKRAAPVVVVIDVIEKAPKPAAESQDEDGSFNSLPPGLKRFHEELERQAPEKVRDQGSGVIIRKDGYILTNRHVVENAESILVRLQDGRSFPATVRGVDAPSDLAVVKIKADGLAVASLADSSKTQVGEFAIAIGSPFGLDFSVTFGHISAKERSNVIPNYEGVSMDQEFLQTDALINPGNSGGPLFNLEGEVIGLNTLIRGLHTGIGFAIPSNLAKEVSDQLVAQGKFTRPWLGIGITAVREHPEFREVVKGIDDGVIVSAILPAGPAAKSDLRPTDVITAVDGKPVSTPQQLRTEIRHKQIGRPVTLAVFRKGKTLDVRVRPGEWLPPATVAERATAGH